MKCHQCEKPGIYDYGNSITLCLKCHSIATDANHKSEQIRMQSFLMHSVMLNIANDDLNSISPWGSNKPRIPVEALAQATKISSTTMNNISINNSNVGVLNAGDLAKIDAVVTITVGTDAEELGALIKNLTEAIVASDNISDVEKRDLGELIAQLGNELASKRSKPVMGAILNAIENRIKGANAAWSLFEKIQPMIDNLIN